MPEVSIIIPVYKTALYLPKCIESVLKQTFKDFEIILVDDGSPDQSSEICDMYAKKDSRIVVIHKRNEGVSVARNTGIEIARGKYYLFIDSDDWIETNMLDKMLSVIKEQNADLVICGTKYYDANYSFVGTGLTAEGIYNSSQLQMDLFAMPSKLGGCIWNKLYSRKCIKDIRYNPKLSNGEDRDFLLRYYDNCEKAVKIADTLYNVYLSHNSASRTISTQVIKEGLKGRKLLIHEGKKRSLTLEVAAINRYIDDSFRVYFPLVKKGIANNIKGFVLIYIQLKCNIFFTIVKAWGLSKLSLNKIRGFLYLWLKA